MPARMTVFIDGQFSQVNMAQINRLAPGELRGKGAFETLQSYNGRIFVFDEHMARLRRSLRLLGIKPYYSSHRIQSLFGDLLKRNNLRNARLRVVVWSEHGQRHTSLVVLRTTKPSKRKYAQGYCASVSELRRNPSRLSHVKTIDYGIFHAARKEAQKKGYDEAILLNDSGYLVEAAYANLFFVKKGVLCTPAVDCGCLNGIIRQKVLKLARGQGIRCRIGRFRLNDLLESDEAFLTNSVIEVMPLCQVNRKRIHSVGPVTRVLQNELARLRRP